MNVLSLMTKSIQGINTQKFTLQVWERIADKLKYSEYKVKLRIKPYAIYFYAVVPNKGAEILYKDDFNNGKALVNPNGFPWLNLSFRPNSPVLRDGNHHSFLNFGFQYIANLVEHAMKQADKHNISFTREGVKNINSYKCNLLKIGFHDYNIVKYVVEKGENIYDIAQKLFLSEYRILEINSNISDYLDVKPGQVINVPNGYSQTTLLYIDKKTNLPIKQEIYDNDGLYEKYIFTDLVVNPDFTEEEFSTKYVDYNF